MPYSVRTFDFKLVQEYTGLNFLQIGELMLDDFLLFVRDAFIYRHMQTKEGQEYLENCKRMETTKADIGKLKQYRKERERNG